SGHLMSSFMSLIPSITTQGRLRCPLKTKVFCEQVHTPCHGIHIYVSSTEMGLRGYWVNAHMPLWIAQKPYLPALAQGWSPRAGTRNFIDMPFGRFLAPPSE